VVVLTLWAALAAVAQQPRRTAWGDPDLHGIYTNEDELNIPIERPDEFHGRSLKSITPAELAEFTRTSNANRQRNAELNNAFNGFSPLRFDLRPSRPWLIVDPPDGRIPALTVAGQQRQAAYDARLAAALESADRANLWERCISLGVPGSMMPSAGGATYHIIQAPGVVAIVYERLHEARIIPVDGRPHVGKRLTSFMGDARGRWDSETLVVETTNIGAAYRRTSPGGAALKIVERFRRTTARAIEWSVTVDDASGWERPWTFAMLLREEDDSQRPLEEGCHEGNYTLMNMLSGARAEEVKR
jgi:hypothetical protein